MPKDTERGRIEFPYQALMLPPIAAIAAMAEMSPKRRVFMTPPYSDRDRYTGDREQSLTANLRVAP
jgi:hypothetical protein